jgi:uncharacterized membrane protein
MKKVLVLVVIMFSVAVQSIAQCAMCRATVESNLSEGRGVIGTGLNFGILYLLVIPYILVASLIFLWFKIGKKELKERQDLQKRLKEIYKQ